MGSYRVPDSCDRFVRAIATEGQRRGYSLARLARECGLSEWTLSDWLYRGRHPRAEKIDKALHGLGLRLCIGRAEGTDVRLDA